MILDGVDVFVKVVQAGGFSAAARQLDMPTTTVSAKIARLEERLGVTLLRRTTRRMSVTEAGEAYFARCVDALKALEEGEEQLQAATASPSRHAPDHGATGPRAVGAGADRDPLHRGLSTGRGGAGGDQCAARSDRGGYRSRGAGEPDAGFDAHQPEVRGGAAGAMGGALLSRPARAAAAVGGSQPARSAAASARRGNQCEAHGRQAARRPPRDWPGARRRHASAARAGAGWR